MSFDGPLRAILQCLIAAQWVCAVGSCSIQDWNAYIIVLWVAFSIPVSAYVYSPVYGVRDWMIYGVNISLSSTTATFRSRRSMLSALLYLSPDKYEPSGTRWIDPILAPSEDRSQWEAALKAYMMTGDAGDDVKAMYW